MLGTRMLRLLWLDMVAKVQFGSNTAGLTMWQFSLPGGRYATLDSKDAWIWHRQTCSSESQDLQDAKKTFSHLRDGCAVDMVPDTTSRRATKFDPARHKNGISATVLKPYCWESHGRLMADHLEAVLAGLWPSLAARGRSHRDGSARSNRAVCCAVSSGGCMNVSFVVSLMTMTQGNCLRD